MREWFARITAYGADLGVDVEHYVISSGLREIIEGSGIAHEFREIYACEFYYNGNGDACWPKLDVNFTNKTQFVYRINKGILDVSRDKELNDSMPDDSKRVPFTNMTVSYTHLITPYHVELEGDLIDELESNGLYF